MKIAALRSVRCIDDILDCSSSIVFRASFEGLVEEGGILSVESEMDDILLGTLEV